MTTDTEPTADDVRLKAERNGDLPAGYGAYDVQPENQREGPCTIISAGLTKREMLAGMAPYSTPTRC